MHLILGANAVAQKLETRHQKKANLKYVFFSLPICFPDVYSRYVCAVGDHHHHFTVYMYIEDGCDVELRNNFLFALLSFSHCSGLPSSHSS